ncbi:hypothetical protein BTJ68_15552, partial [Hortaea werneckii EXF-2000]
SPVHTKAKDSGNKFLDDLRHADALIHVVDVSGTTDADGKSTRGYDPSNDIVWLRSEIVNWVLGNLNCRKWGRRQTRRHAAIKASNVETLQGQFSGYGATGTIIARTLDKLAIKQPLQDWDNDTVEQVVNAFVDEKFPTVLALNKIDHPDADKNVSKIARLVPPERIRALLRHLRSLPSAASSSRNISAISPAPSSWIDPDAAGSGLKEMDEKLKTRIENLKDMVLYRFGSTGVNQVLTRASELLGLVAVFPVREYWDVWQWRGRHGFRACGGFQGLCPREEGGVRSAMCIGRLWAMRRWLFVETVGGIRVSEEDEVGPGKNDILSFKVGRG